MKLTLPTLLFLLVPTTVLALVHWYFWARLVKPMALPRPWRRGLGVFLVIAWIGLPVGMILGRVLPAPWGHWLSYPTFLWMGIMTFLLTLTLFTEPVRLGAWLSRLRAGKDATPENEERRRFLARALGASVAGLTLAATGAAVAGALRTPGVRRVRVVLPDLPPSFDGFTITQFTDLHVADHIRRPYVERVVEVVNELKSDLIVFTGDLVDGSVPDLSTHVAPLAGLRSRLGVYSVTGNHDYYSGVEAWLVKQAELGFRVLRNERVTIANGAESIELAGVDDSGSGRGGLYPKGHGADVAKAMKDAPAGRTTILLAHQPKEIEAATRHGASLMLSGHTHGGQIWPFRHLVGFQQPYIDGLHLHREKTWIYVSRGTGFWGPPMRLGSPSEITRIELRRSGVSEVTWA